MIYRWMSIQGALTEHKMKLAAALDMHAFYRDVDDLNERINEKVKHYCIVCCSQHG